MFLVVDLPPKKMVEKPRTPQLSDGVFLELDTLVVKVREKWGERERFEE
jgi:hypothetical protein